MKRQATMLGCAALALAGCQQGTRTTIELLRAGDPAVCIARDVEDTLRRLISPGGQEAGAYTIALADTSLEAFDQAVARATCNTALSVEGPDGPVIERTMIDYVVTPTAQNPDTFLVSGPTEPLRRRIETAISDAAAQRAQSEETKRQQQALTALIKPGWLIGRWVQEAQGSQACVDGPYDEYARGGRYTDGSFRGRWTLQGQGLTIIGPAASSLLSITEADTNGFTVRDTEDEARSYRRCTRDDIPPAPAASNDTLTDDLQKAETAADPAR